MKLYTVVVYAYPQEFILADHSGEEGKDDARKRYAKMTDGNGVFKVEVKKIESI